VHHEELVKLHSVINNLLPDNKTIKVLEAGCGSLSYISLKQNAFIVGIDKSEKQLQKNTVINEKILGDIQSYDLPASEFDVIICFNVIEHLSHPEFALKNFQKAVKKNGIIILAFPNVLSLKGLITKYTPHSFHIWVYRNIYGSKLAGTDDQGPFPTFLRSSISPDNIKRFALDNALSIEYFRLYEGQHQKKFREKYKIVNAVWRLLNITLKAFSFGKIDANNSECFIILKK
jgi:2-polyprenyl-3-methyl-5-hydroxy-6-metoxy-1,4-benzoquinol methylase